MSWLSRLFNPNSDLPDPPGMKRIDITFTEEEQAAILSHNRELNSFAPEPGQVLYVVPEMERPLIALGLVKHVRRQLSTADKLTPAEYPALLDKIIKTQVKAYGMHALPFYIYLWALLSEEKGDTETSKRLCTLFLSQQAEFRPSKIDECIIQFIKIEGWYDVEEAIKVARKMTASRTVEQPGREHLPPTEDSYLERCCIDGLMTAIEDKNVTKQWESLTPDSQMNFMIAYECCMMWAIRSGLEKVLKPEEVRSAVIAMRRHLAKHGWYERLAFKKMWAQMKLLMPFAMTISPQPDAPPPYPLAEMVEAANQAGYPFHLSGFDWDIKFGIHVLVWIQQLSRAAEEAAQEYLQGK